MGTDSTYDAQANETETGAAVEITDRDSGAVVETMTFDFSDADEASAFDDLIIEDVEAKYGSVDWV